MKRFFCLAALLLFAIVFQLLGCTDTAPDIVKTRGEETTAPVETLAPEPIAAKPTPAEETFEALRRKHPTVILDDNFVTLRQVTASERYMAFLMQEYPTDEPFQTYEAYLQVAPPDPGRYLPFLEAWIGEPTDDDIAVIHRMTARFRAANITLFAKDFADIRNVLTVLEKRLGVLEEAPVDAFLKRHHLEETEHFANAFGAFVAETEAADARWLHEQFKERHGIHSGMLWSVLRKPALVGELMQHFSSKDLFLDWVEAKRVPNQE